LRRSRSGPGVAQGVGGAGEGRRHLVAPGPAHLGQLVGQGLGGAGLAVDQGRPAERRIVVPRVDHEGRRAHHLAAALGGPHAREDRAHRRQEVDRLAAAEEHRQGPPGHRRPAPGQDRQRQLGGLAPDPRVIAVGVGLVADDRVGQRDPRAGQVAVEIVGHRHRHVADRVLDQAQDRALGIGDAVDPHRAVERQDHAVGASRAQPLGQPAGQGVVAGAIELAARRGPRRQDRHRRGAGGAQGRARPGQLGLAEEPGHLVGVAIDRGQEVVALEVVALLEVAQHGRDRRQRVGLLHQAGDRDARHHFLRRRVSAPRTAASASRVRSSCGP
jgi:hypothetical protein